MNVFRARPDLLHHGMQMAPLPAEPSVDVKRLSDELTKMRNERDVVKTKYKTLEYTLVQARVKIAEFEAETPSSQLEKVGSCCSTSGRYY